MQTLEHLSKIPIGPSLLMGSGTLTLSYSGNFLKLLVVEGNKVRHWSLTPFNPSLIRGDTVVDPTGLGRIIRAALDKLKVHQSKAVAAFPGFRALARIMTLPNAADMAPSEVIPQQARRAYGAVAENSYFYWQLLRKDKSTQQFYVLAVPRDAVDGFTETLERARLKPYKVELTSLALARAVHVPTAAIVNLDPPTLEILIVVDSTPMLSFSDTLTELSGPGLANLVVEQLQRIVPFHNERYRDRPLPPNAPVYITGSVAVDQELISTVQANLGNPVQAPNPPPFSYPKEFQPSAYMVNLGLAMKERKL
jgi:hypothetical protein